jgi:hypothetical protein
MKQANKTEQKIKVRFNLGKGKNYMKWKVQCGNQSEYYSPEEYTLFLYGCQLKNHKKTAEKINQGANKSVCAWILCDNIFLGQNTELPTGGEQLKYNPRTQPNWVAGAAGEIVDDQFFDHIWSDGRKLFGIK